jgi:hypothetical protein
MRNLNTTRPRAAQWRACDLNRVALTQVQFRRNDAQIRGDVQPAHDLASQRIEVVDVVLDAGDSAQALGLDVELLHRLHVRPRWRRLSDALLARPGLRDVATLVLAIVLAPMSTNDLGFLLASQAASCSALLKIPVP